MTEKSAVTAADVCSDMVTPMLPAWDEMPDFDLYMDQLLGLITRYFYAYPGIDDKGITASMVNNYVKLGVIPPPIKKKYTKEHLVYLISICVLKTAMPIPTVSSLIKAELDRGMSCREMYETFRSSFSRILNDSLERASRLQEPAGITALESALRAHAEQAIAQEVINSIVLQNSAEKNGDKK